MVDADRTFATIPTRRGEQLQIGINEFRGRRFVAIRIWYETDDGEWRPSGKGTNVRLELLPDIAAGIQAALEAARREGLVE